MLKSEGSSDTIAAIATPSGKGGVAIVRVSGPASLDIAQQLLGRKPKKRLAHYLPFIDIDGSIIDTGIALFFQSPNSFTGEDILELQGHGGPVVMDMLLKRVLVAGARLAAPGEFTERAYLNNKIDLAQAEAVADLIESSTEQAAKSAQRSLQGLFSSQIHKLVEELIKIRLYIEAAIDFVDEEIDFLADGVIETRIQQLIKQLELIQHSAKQGALLRDGMTVVIAGRPNAGKSSLLNALAGYEAAIVTEVEGTTRDVLRERIQIDGMPLHIIDTAGLRESSDRVEQEGIRRAHEEIKKADRILLIIDDREHEEKLDDLLTTLPQKIKITRIYNKTDLTGRAVEIKETVSGTEIALSAKNGDGMAELHNHLKACMGFESGTDDVFIARRRHLDAIKRADVAVKESLIQLKEFKAGELAAEELKLAQDALSEITGEFSSDDLLGRIFSSFCIGK
ncbi:MAG: tRNA uridine-5-carboxymethylaminomethyl(34) synthesis GTPase MnmE [Gammaproteobacteria bacterium]|nr:MAG: tRNA uridine-5-carboxymethylaminomethyl(34) synthesis GTPase MnmE [Gammaproteobacteria bacterium]